MHATPLGWPPFEPKQHTHSPHVLGKPNQRSWQEKSPRAQGTQSKPPRRKPTFVAGPAARRTPVPVSRPASAAEQPCAPEPRFSWTGAQPPLQAATCHGWRQILASGAATREGLATSQKHVWSHFSNHSRLGSKGLLLAQGSNAVHVLVLRTSGAAMRV